jgi:hypothetical protein
MVTYLLLPCEAAPSGEKRVFSEFLWRGTLGRQQIRAWLGESPARKEPLLSEGDFVSIQILKQNIIVNLSCEPFCPRIDFLYSRILYDMRKM